MLRYIGSLVIVTIALYLGGFLSKEPKPPVLKDEWWGKEAKKAEPDTSIKPFKVSIPKKVLNNLKNRLEAARFGEDLNDGDFHYGFQVSTMKKVVQHWKTEYKWEDQEKILNSFQQFKTNIDGIDIHFLDVLPPDTNKAQRTLLIVHGWPGSVWEFYKIIPLLTEQGFRVIAPSIPGYGFSEAPHKQGFDPSDAANIFHKLMKRLNIDRYYVQGGDWGSFITMTMAQVYPQNVIGMHNNMVAIPKMTPGMLSKLLLFYFFPSLYADQGYQPSQGTTLGGLFYFLFIEGGYFHIQSTKPDTVGFGLNDSPVGLAAYILEKFSTWTNTSYKDMEDGNLTEKYTLDELLTNVMLYWFSGNVEASMRLYKETILSEVVHYLEGVPVKVPAGLAVFPYEIAYVPQSLAAGKYHNIVQYTMMPRGGHFAAFEEPELLADDIISFVKKIENMEK